MPADDPSPLSPDDPRLSEWIDGRLPAADAEAVEEVVRHSERLGGLVADIKAIKEAVASLPAMEPPAGFVEQVMQAVVETSPGGDDERIVAEEWREIETERLATERAEADADADLGGETPAGTVQGRPWPWMSLAGALAAGLLVAVLLNLPSHDAKQVALGPAESARRALDALEVDERAAGRPAVVDADQVAGTAARLSEPAAPVAGDVIAPVEGPGSRGAEDLRSGRAAEALVRRQSGEAAPAAAAAARLRSEPAEEFADTTEAAASSTAAAAPAPEVITIQVWGAEGRKELGELMAASGLRLESAEPAAADADLQARQESQRDAGATASLLGDEAVFLVGPAGDVAAFLARVGADRVASGDAAAEEAAGGDAPTGGAGPPDRQAVAKADSAPVRVLIRVREAPGFTPPTPPR